jgi:hypothetical protein
MLAVCGLMTNDTRVAGVTVREAEPETLPEVAEIVAVPLPWLVASPALFTTAVDVLFELQLAVALRSCVLPSVNVPVAVNCWVVPSAIEELAGDIEMDARAAALTVSVVVPTMLFEVALIVVVPVPWLVARPCDPVSLLMPDVEGVSELQRTIWVRSCVLLSLKVPVAINCCETPSGITGIAGVTAIETSAAGVTMTTVEALIVPDVALTLVVPTPVPVTTPCPSTLATFWSFAAQLTVPVTSRVLPSV